MKLLLDTHVLLWWLDDPAHLSSPARSDIANPQNIVMVSAVVAWEIAIKRALGKLTAPPDLVAAIVASGFAELAITMEHALRIETLPPHHRDPFDRLLIAQAMHENCTLVSRDPQIQRYGGIAHLTA